MNQAWLMFQAHHHRHQGQIHQAVQTARTQLKVHKQFQMTAQSIPILILRHLYAQAVTLQIQLLAWAQRNKVKTQILIIQVLTERLLPQIHSMIFMLNWNLKLTKEIKYLKMIFYWQVQELKIRKDWFENWVKKNIFNAIMKFRYFCQ